MKMKTIKQKIVVKAMPEEVYDSYMNADKQSEFTGSSATCDPTVGGSFTAWDGYISGKNLELEKGMRIVQEWKTTDWPPYYPPSSLELTFKAVKGGTEITMVHSDVPEELAEDTEQGWIDYYWEPLKEYFRKRK